MINSILSHMWRLIRTRAERKHYRDLAGATLVQKDGGTLRMLLILSPLVVSSQVIAFPTILKAQNSVGS
jgi:hypothetical protein